MSTDPSESTTPELPDLTPATEEAQAARDAANARVEAALQAFQDQTRVMPQGMRIDLPPNILDLATVNALATMLFDQGIIDRAEFVTAKLAAYGELVEGAVEQAKELKSQVGGLLLPGGQALPKITDVPLPGDNVREG